MDILRTPLGRDFCRYLNTRGKRQARRALMRELRPIRSSLETSLLTHFARRRISKVGAAAVANCIRSTLAELAGPEIHIQGLENGKLLIKISSPPARINLNL